jgi:hypothetical protein
MVGKAPNRHHAQRVVSQKPYRTAKAAKAQNSSWILAARPPGAPPAADGRHRQAEASAQVGGGRQQATGGWDW